MGIKIECNPDLALRNISEFKNGNRKKEECIPEIIKAGEVYDFLKSDQRNYMFRKEIPLVETLGNENISRPKAGILMLEATHFLEDGKMYTRGKYKVLDVFFDDKIHFESHDRVGERESAPSSL